MSDYDSYFARRDRQSLGTTLINQPDPERAARANRLASQLRLPAAIIESDIASYEARDRAQRAQRLAEQRPKLAAWAAEPRNAAVAADDMGPLAKLGDALSSGLIGLAGSFDNALTSAVGYQDVVPRVPNVVRRSPGAIASGAASVVGGVARAVQASQDVGERLDLTAGLQRRLFGGTMEGAVGGFAGDIAKSAEKYSDRMKPKTGDYLTDQMLGGVANVPNSVASLTAGLTGRAFGLSVKAAAMVGSALGGVSQGGQSYGKAREEGLGVGVSALYGATDAATEVAGGMVGNLKFLKSKDVGDRAIARFLKNQVGEQIGEQATTVAQDFSAWVALPSNRKKTLADFVKERPEAAMSTAIQTLVGGALTNATITGVERAFGLAGSTARKAVREDRAAQQAELRAGIVDKLMERVGESKTRTRDPDALEAYIAAHTDGSAIEQMFVPAEAVATYFQSIDEDYREDEFWGGYADQIDEGLATGGDVVLPTAAAVTRLAGTPAWEALRNDVRTTFGGPSPAEARSQEEQREQYLDQAAAGIADQLAADQEADAPRAAIYQDIRDKLTNAGHTQEFASTNAELVAQRYATRAERTGKPLTGTETQAIEVNSVLPGNLAPIVAKDAGDVAVQSVINVMRRGLGVQSDRAKFGDSLVEWIAKNGGIEDKGGDLTALGADQWHRGKPGRRKLVRPVTSGQGSMIPGGQENANTPDELALRAMEAGFFPAGTRPEIGDLFNAIENELRGTPVYAQYAGGLTDADNTRAAAEELTQILEQRGLDPTKATDAEIKATLRQYQQEQANGLQQTFSDGPRGQISFTQGRSIIDLFQARNTSTFAHEMGHQWLEELRADALDPDATDQLRADWQMVQDWFKANGHPLKDGTIPVDAHELWARGIERYLMEGKAPTSTLRAVFDKFKSWLLQIYELTANLRAPISPEIREVMDRLFATDQEIEAARDQQALSDLFNAAADAGMSDAEFVAYKGLAMDARDEAHSALLFRVMSSIRAARTKAWKDEEATVRIDVTDRVDRRPEFRALHFLRTGKMRDDPDGVTNRLRIDKQWLIDRYGEGVLAQMPGGVPPLYVENGTHPDEIAEMVGFSTGDEMVRTLITLQERKRELAGQDDKRSVQQALIDEETAQEMRDRHGDPLNDGSIEEEALAFVQNDTEGEKMAAELRVLARRSNRQPTPYSLAKDWARDKIASSTVQEATSGAAIQRYSRAAAKAGKAAEAAMVKRDAEEAFKQKQAQMLNNALVAEATRAREAVEKARDRLAGYARRRTIKSMDQDYLEQIHDLLEQVEFRPRTQASIDRQVSFEQWAAAREAEGHDVTVPASFARSLGRTNWTRLTVEKLLGLDDAVKQIAHLGRFKQELLDGAERRAYEEVVGEALSGINNLPPRDPVQFDPSWSDRMKGKIESMDAALLKMETIVDWLDGGNAQGVFNRVVFRPIAEAQARESDMTRDYFARIRTIMEAVPQVERWAERVSVPELFGNETVTRQRLVAMALNMGNEGNIQRLTDGYNWSRETAIEVLNRELTVDDWRFVQSVWDTIDTLWPEIAAMERRVNGVEPERVEAKAIETSAGTLRGGYYPAIYDTARDLRAEQNAGKAGDLLDAKYTRATTRSSATKDRLDKVKRPILLEVGVINRHLGEVIHDITHREAIINAHKFLNDGRIQKAVNETLGPQIRKQFQPWLKHVANQWAAERAGNEGLAAFMSKARANTTAVGMGFRLSTIITQVSGYSNSQETIGGTWLPNAIAQAAAHPIDSFRFVAERSGEIRNRMETLDRDIAQLVRGLDLNPLAKGLDAARNAARFMYHGIGYADRLVVIPTWIAAYNKAVAGGMEEQEAIYAADKTVRQSQGAGGAKDLAAVQTGAGRWGEALKLSTMFYSYFSALYQRQRTLGRDVAGTSGKPRDLPNVMARALWLVIIPPVLSQIIAGKGPDEDDDWGIWSFKQMLFNALAPIPFVRDLAQPLWDKTAGNRSFGYQMSPVQRAGETLVNVGGDVGRIVRGEETKRATKDVLEATGYVTGLVPGQIATATQFLVDIGYGEQDPETVGEWYRGLTKGKTKDEK